MSASRPTYEKNRLNFFGNFTPTRVWFLVKFGRMFMVQNLASLKLDFDGVVNMEGPEDTFADGTLPPLRLNTMADKGSSERLSRRRFLPKIYRLCVVNRNLTFDEDGCRRITEELDIVFDQLGKKLNGYTRTHM